MPLSSLTSRAAVLDAVAEYDSIGAEAFLTKYGFQPSRRYFLIHDGRSYDSKAIVGAAHGFQFPDRGPLPANTFSGGEATVARLLRTLGFRMESPRVSGMPLPALAMGRTYSWDELGDLLHFKPGYLSAVGGMLPRPLFGAVLLITHPGGGRSFDYEDYWDHEDLIYSGRGKVGDQVLEGVNADVARNRRTLVVFENAGPRQLRHLGVAECIGYWPATGLGSDGHSRTFYRFRLRFLVTPQPRDGQTAQIPPPGHRVPRAFDPNRPPPTLSPATPRRSPEETLALQEKAIHGHQAILATLHRHLASRGWVGLNEVPAAIDLYGTAPDGRRIIFEAKTISADNEVTQCRCALAQLLEYRFFYGTGGDALCIVVDRPVSDARIRFLEGAGVALALSHDGAIRQLGTLSPQVLGPGFA